jgi:hypothetical protein
MRNLVTAPMRASRHLVIWIVWQSTGVTLLAPSSRSTQWARSPRGREAEMQAPEPAVAARSLRRGA